MNIPKPNNKGKDSSEEKAKQLLLLFLEQHIQNFWENSKHKSEIIEKEDVLTEMLHHYLMQKAKTQNFYFTTQAIQAEGKKGTFRKVDIGVSIFVDDSEELIEVRYFFCIEAKYLPSEDYVLDEYAAIKRFKANEHGIRSKFDKTPLPENGIIAYVKSRDYQEHLLKINDEIQKLNKDYSIKTDEFGLNWQTSEQLTPEPNKTGRYNSEHPRIDKSMVKLHHFWVNVSEKPTSIE